MSGLISNKPQRQAQYNAAKAGVHQLTRSLAGEWAARGLRVNSVAPTYVDTPMSSGGFTDPTLYPIWMEMTPMKRVARPDEIASAILFLASDASSALTGFILVVGDCGYTIWSAAGTVARWRGGGGEAMGKRVDILPAKRRAMILDRLRARWRRLDPGAFGGDLGGSISTIRRDIEQLVEEGYLERTHGGALLIQHRRAPPSSARRT